MKPGPIGRGAEILLPLPLESEFSYALFVAWRKGWDARTVSRAMPGKAMSCLTNATTETAHLLGADGAGETEFAPALDLRTPLFTRYLVSPRLRICPLCLAAGYHCVLYQIQPLPLCPIHQCDLVSTCQSCGEPLPLQPASWRHFRAAYECKACGCPWSGACASYGERSEFWHLRSMLWQRIKPYADWACKVSTLGFLSRYAADAPLNPRHPWQPESQLLFSAAAQMAPLPLGMDRPLFDHVSVLTWLPRLPAEKIQTAQKIAQLATVRAVIERRMYRWRQTYARRTGASAASPVDALAAALACGTPITSGHLGGVPFEWPAGGVPRLGACAYYLGVMAAVIWSAHRYHRVDARNCRPPLSLLEAEGTLGGTVFFPEVPGLSLRPFA